MAAARRVGRGLLLELAPEPAPMARLPANNATANATNAPPGNGPAATTTAHAGGVVDVGTSETRPAVARVGLETVVIIGVLAAISLAAGFYLALAATTRKAKSLVSFKPRALTPAASRREHEPPTPRPPSTTSASGKKKRPSATEAEPGALSPIPYALVQALGAGTSAEGPQVRRPPRPSIPGAGLPEGPETDSPSVTPAP